MSLGFHITQGVFAQLGARNYAEAAEKLALEHGSRCGQIFIMSPHQTKWMNLKDAEIRGLRAKNFHLYAHANYQSHMCNASTVGICKMQIKRAGELELAGLIVHLENKSIEKNVHAAAVLCAYRAEVKGARIVFENNAIVNNPPFGRPEELKQFIVGLTQLGFGHEDFGVCIDTAHLWSSGAKINTSAAMKEWLDGVGDARWIRLFHLNDNESALGGKDLHARIGAGSIWPIRDAETGHRSFRYGNIRRWPAVGRDKEPGFIEVLRFATLHKIDIILERGDDISAIEEMRTLLELRQHFRVRGGDVNGAGDVNEAYVSDDDA